jgi:hypothetical protein
MKQFSFVSLQLSEVSSPFLTTGDCQLMTGFGFGAERAFSCSSSAIRHQRVSDDE